MAQEYREFAYNLDMGGITNYYHGESGQVVGLQHVSNEQRVRVLRLRDNPHREFAFDYEGGDVHIDPLVKVGDRVYFVREDWYGGIWVREQDRLYPQLQWANNRVLEEIRNRAVPGTVTVRLQGVWADQYIASSTRRETGSPFTERPATEVSFFLSFSSRNVLLARQIFQDLKTDAKVEVWFDLDQAGEAPEHRRRIDKWLREAIHSNRGFILVWTKAAKESQWVRKEISWALEKASCDPDFRFIILKLDRESLPADLTDAGYLVDCYNLWPVHGINEELFAAVTKRQGRNAWVEQHRRRGVEFLDKEQGNFGYEPFLSDSGVAVSLRHWEEGGELKWQLNYEKDRRLHKAFGRGDEQAVDLHIRSGDEVGLYVCHRSPLVRFWPGVTLWMRSGDLQIKPEDVLTMYWEKSSNKGTTSPDLRTRLIRARRNTANLAEDKTIHVTGRQAG